MSELEKLITLAQAHKITGAETISVRLTGHDLKVWKELKGSHPNLNVTDLLKEGIFMRAIASAAFSGGDDMQYQDPRTGSLIGVHDLLGLAKPISPSIDRV